MCQDSGTSDRLRWLVCLATALSLATMLYVLTAPFILPRVYASPEGRFLYRPLTCALERHWFGRGMARGYFYGVCKMSLLLPVELKSDPWRETPPSGQGASK